MAPVDREKLRSHLDHIRGDLIDFETFVAAILERNFADPPQS